MFPNPFALPAFCFIFPVVAVRSQHFGAAQRLTVLVRLANYPMNYFTLHSFRSWGLNRAYALAKLEGKKAPIGAMHQHALESGAWNSLSQAPAENYMDSNTDCVVEFVEDECEGMNLGEKLQMLDTLEPQVPNPNPNLMPHTLSLSPFHLFIKIFTFIHINITSAHPAKH